VSTSRWASSLANIEARMRRSLGIAGPINLTLDKEPKLTPVVIADDLTRPGSVATDFRGRRFAISSVTGTISFAARGQLYWVAAGLNTSVGNVGKGGVILDSLEFWWQSATPTQVIRTEIRMAVPWTTHPAASIRDGFMVDPISDPGAPSVPPLALQSPMLSGFSVTVPAAGFGNRVWEGWQAANGSRVVIDLDYFLHEQAFLTIGNVNTLAASAELGAVVRGRVF
jgi:hypothetical protein